VPQLYGSTVSEVVAKGKISGRVVEELGKGASHSSWINWLYGGRFFLWLALLYENRLSWLPGVHLVSTKSQLS